MEIALQTAATLGRRAFDEGKINIIAYITVFRKLPASKALLTQFPSMTRQNSAAYDHIAIISCLVENAILRLFNVAGCTME